MVQSEHASIIFALWLDPADKEPLVPAQSQASLDASRLLVSGVCDSELFSP